MIDLFIIIAFLVLTLVVGLSHGRNVRTIRDYAIGNRNFSTVALVATIVATYASGSGFMITLSKTYSSGFYYVIAFSFSIVISFYLLSFYVIPRMGEFLGKVSIADAMGSVYGNKVRVITAIAGSIGSTGLITVQFRAFGNIISYFSSIDPSYAIAIAGIITTIYSAFGGIRSVTFTDIFQGFTFGVIIPLLGFIIWSEVYNSGASITDSLADSKFNLANLFDASNDGFFEFILLLLYFSIPTISPIAFQRISMGYNVTHAQKAFMYSAIIFVVIKLLTAWIPFLIYTLDNTIAPNALLPYIIDRFSFVGLKGFIVVAIVAFAMSTADSRINSASVLLTNDVFSLFYKDERTSLLFARACSCALGALAILMSLIETDLLSIVIRANSFYSPLVAPPFLLAIFGFRTSAKSTLIGMFCAFVVTTLWKFLPSGFLPISQGIIGFFLAMFCNIIFLFGSHYVLKQPGGWVGIKNQEDFEKEKSQRISLFKNFVQCLYSIKDFDIKKFCKDISPRNEISYTMVGIYFVVCTISTMYSTQIELLGVNAKLIKIIYPLMLITGTSIAMYQIWPVTISNNIKTRIIELLYPISIFYMLLFFSCFFVLVSKFSILQVLLFSVNLMIAALTFGWKASLILIPIGNILGVLFYSYNFSREADVSLDSPEFVLIYMVLFLGTAILLFVKPKQERLKASETKVYTLESEVTLLDHKLVGLNGKVTTLNNQVTHYSNRVNNQAKEIERLGLIAQKILNNVNHELRLPVGNVINFVEMLRNSLSMSNDEQLKAISDEVYKNSTRLCTMILNMLDLAMLDANKIELQKKTINLGVIVEERVKNCRITYLRGKPIDFKLVLEPEVLVYVDPNYIGQLIDNVIINAINFTDSGTIDVTLTKSNGHVYIKIKDQGVGIPPDELSDIFTPFKMGSNVESKAQGRGVGLALCKTVAEAHDGRIIAQSDDKGTTFKIILPTSNN